jgi:hypothetical protein
VVADADDPQIAFVIGPRDEAADLGGADIECGDQGYS